MEYVSSILKFVKDLQELVQKTQNNLAEINSSLNACSNKPLYQRKDGKKFTVLALDDRMERAEKRYQQISAIAERVKTLLKDNMELFEMTDKHDIWQRYVKHIDSIVMEHLFKAVGCR